MIVLKSMQDVQVMWKDHYEKSPLFWRFWNEAGIIVRTNFTAKAKSKNLINMINKEVDSYVDRFIGFGINIFSDERLNIKEFHNAIIQWGSSDYYDGKHKSFFKRGMVRS